MIETFLRYDCYRLRLTVMEKSCSVKLSSLTVSVLTFTQLHFTSAAGLNLCVKLNTPCSGPGTAACVWEKLVFWIES